MSEQNQPTNINDNSVLLVVEFNKIGNTRKVNAAKVEVNADKEMLRLSKKLLDAPELEAITSHDGKTRQWLATRALPSMFKEGVWRIPNSIVVEVDDYLATRAAERQELVNAFGAVYEQRVEEAIGKLRDVSNPRDYFHTAEGAMAKFGMTWNYVAFSTPDTLKNIRSGLFEREREKIAAQFAAANEQIQQLLRVRMADLVNHLLDRLGEKPDGKKKIFRDTLTENVQQFLETFEARNLTGDAQLKALVEQAKDVLTGVDAKTLRESDNVREYVQKGFSDIKSKMDGMIVDAPSRKYNFD